MYIWKRYFYKEIISTFAFLLFFFYALYISLDLMAHIKDLRSGHTSFFTWVVYYFYTFFRRLDILLPFTVLIGSIRLLVSFQTKNELVALLASGIPLRTLLRPFLIVALALTSFLYANFEWILPVAVPQAIYIQENSFGKRTILEEETPLREVMLKDGSKMIYRSYNPRLKQFQDVFWIASLDTIYHMKVLACTEKMPAAKLVDIITRDPSGALQKSGSYAELSLEQMQFDEESLKSSITPPRDQSLSQLLSQMILYTSSTSDRANDIRNNLYYKISFPLVCLLAFLAIAPHCIRFSRNRPVFMIYLLGIGSLFCFFLLLQVAYVFGKNQIIAPWIAMLLPWMTSFYICGIRYAKI